MLIISFFCDNVDPFDNAALAYSKIVHSLGRYGYTSVPACRKLGMEMFRYRYRQPAFHSELFESLACLVQVGPKGVNMGEGGRLGIIRGELSMARDE